MTERMCRSIQTEPLQDWFQLPLDEVVGVKAPAFRAQETWLLGVPVLNVEPKTFCKLRRESEESLLAVLRPLQFAFPPTSLNRDCLLVQVDISDVQATDFSAPDAGLRYQPEDGLVWLIRGIDDLLTCATEEQPSFTCLRQSGSSDLESRVGLELLGAGGTDCGLTCPRSEFRFPDLQPIHQIRR